MCEEASRQADLLGFLFREAPLLLDEGGNHVGHAHSAAACSIEQHLGVLGLGALSLQPIDEPACRVTHLSCITGGNALYFYRPKIVGD